MIVGLFTGLLGLFLRLIFVPFSLALTLIAIPIKIFKRHLYLLLVIALGFFFYYKFQHAAPPAELTPAPAVAQNQATNNNPQQPVIVQPVRRIQDGNSSFSVDLYASMTDQERAYYSQFFFWAMGNLASGKNYPWTNGNIGGEIMPVDTFTNNRGNLCRHFQETLKVHDTQQRLTGIACQDFNPGKWCKLKPNATPACGLGHKSGFFDGIMSSLKGIF